MNKIIENYTDSTTWFRKYDDGWIEQGGFVLTTMSTSGSYSLTFPKTFVNNPLIVRTTMYAPRSSDSSGSALTVKTGTLTNSGVTFVNDGYGTNKQGFYWEACGI